MVSDDLADALDSIDGLHWEEDSEDATVHLTNLWDVNGMHVAEALTYLSDEGYMYFGPMSAEHENGSLMMRMPED